MSLKAQKEEICAKSCRLDQAHQQVSQMWAPAPSEHIVPSICQKFENIKHNSKLYQISKDRDTPNKRT